MKYNTYYPVFRIWILLVLVDPDSGRLNCPRTKKFELLILKSSLEGWRPLLEFVTSFLKFYKDKYRTYVAFF
jgi:hypothetical protein